ncbi:metallophosphoesterase family protein [Metapseudomonas otitidis]|uniref:metallophosphoesterase family protein n=1 Tax=Metapseudomonas otitidis TaxID=319939 RepID=UPI001AAF363B|nr:metallophosphoesterase family protein [Pseudomonas otitidis]MBO2929033.1 metallophosphoesterase family protein [Pseudomonas otitidis]
MTLRIGLIADTHGLLSPQALAALEGCDHILHAGDIGKPEILDALRQLAPLSVVRGNNDTQVWAQAIPHDLSLQLGGACLYLVHDQADIPTDLATRGVDAIITGHSHKPLITQRDGILHINPGSAGPRRFKLPIAVGSLLIEDGRVRAELRELDI